MKSRISNLVIAFTLAFGITLSGQIIINPTGGGSGGGGGGGASWGSITGTLSDQTDLQTALNLKAPLSSPTFTGNVGIETAGVRLTAADGVLTLLGLGNGNDENLIIDFDNSTANRIAFSSSTSVTHLDFSSIILEVQRNFNADGDMFASRNANENGNSWFTTYVHSGGVGGLRAVEYTGANPTSGSIRWRGDLNSWVVSVDAGTAQYSFNITHMGIPGNQNILFVGRAFASLGTPSNGAITYCTDCTIASPCAGSGTGAIAKRLNGAWVCN